ncbi:MAG: hypothetical protein MJY91_03285 [Bacteroidales bacterium]|nr:hypothetical protein [Bacteroidales bacterium]
MKQVKIIRSVAVCLTMLPFCLLFSCCRNAGGVSDGEGQSSYAFIDGDSIISSYVTEFNSDDDEVYGQTFRNIAAEQFLRDNVPALDCPDKELEKTYYFRWWTFRKHVKSTPDGYVITEFLPDVPWAGKYNAINCPACHHYAEGRWLRNTEYLNDYARFWLSDGATPRAYSFPIADATLKLYSVHGDMDLIRDTYEGLKDIYAAWESDHRDPNGLFWQVDGNDGMEVSISGSMSPDAKGYRATINSYMYADAMALSVMAEMLGRSLDVTVYKEKAEEIRKLMDEYLWDEEACFYKVIPRNGRMEKSPAREEHGYVPWVFDIPDESKSGAWLQLKDEQGFKAPYGPTTAERRAAGFKVVYEGHECQWNGPSWPFATSQTLTGLASYLRRFGEGVMTKEDYYETLCTFSNSHRRINEEGRKICWIDENLNPFTGEWMARKMLIERGSVIKERGKDYNHSSFCDLVISGLIGLQPQPDGTLFIEPLIPEGKWSYFCLDGIVCMGRKIAVMYDRDGTRYGRGKGFFVFVDGKEAFRSDSYSVRRQIL